MKKNLFKRITAMTMAAIMILAVVFAFSQPVKTQAEEFAVSVTDDGLEYMVTPNNTVSIKGYTGTAEEVIIPEMIDGLPVTEISCTVDAGGAFEGNKTITAVYLPSSVTSIYPYTFKGCSNLTKVNLPSTMERIANGVFDGCSKLSNIEFPEGVQTIGMSAFKDCTSLTNIIVPEGVTAIWENAFNGTKNLQNIYLPKTLTSVSPAAFKNSAVNHVLYGGSEDDWNAIENYDTNFPTTETAAIHFNAAADAVKATDTVVNPDCTTNGYTVYKCSLCDKEIHAEFVPALGHNFENGKCTRCGLVKLTGDVDENGAVDASDALIALQVAAKLFIPTETQIADADVNKDGSVDASDALIILQKAAKLID